MTARSVAMLLPDVPRWVELRSMLLSGSGRMLAPAWSDPLTLVTLDVAAHQAVVVGHPPTELVAAAVQLSSSGAARTSLAPAALPAWRSELAVLRILGPAGLVPVTSAGPVRPLVQEELVSAPGVEPALREELLDRLAAGVTIMAAYAEEWPVAFCYAGSVTERWWDISIDTVEPYRRQGYATRCVASCIDSMAREGKQPVWGAVASNLASAGLAAKLGFVAVDGLVVFSRPE